MRLRTFLEIDYVLLITTLVLVVFGILFIYSSGVSGAGLLITNMYQRQIIWAGAGLFGALVITLFNYRRIYNLSVYFYLLTLALLLYTFFFGQVIRGSRWLRIGPFGVQVSEFAKLTTIVFLAWFLDSTKRNQPAIRRFIISGIIVFIPMVVILLQPDLGTALVFLPILLGTTYIAGLPVRYILFVGFSFVFSGIFLVLPLWQTVIMQNTIPTIMILTDYRFVAAGCLILLIVFLIAAFGYFRYQKRYFYWISYVAGIFIISLAVSYAAQQILRPYQVMRLIVFLDANVDPRGSGWHIIQSITAIGSGGLFGKGFLQGTQSQFQFLPEQSTDFIFSILSEEWGFVGGIMVFALFLILLLRLIRIITNTNDSFGSYIVAGLVSMYAFHFFVNVGMTMGIMPITGIPLMFVSYGGSALLTAMAGIGLALSVHVRRFLRP